MRRGVTLVEMLVVLCVLGVLGGISALAVGSLRRPATPASATAWRQGRERALRTGTAVSVAVDSDRVVRFLPDGRVLGDGADPLAGELNRAR